MLRMVAFALSGMAGFLILSGGNASAQDARGHVSQCQAIASRLPGATYASFRPDPSGKPLFQLAQSSTNGASTDRAAREQVKITFIGHSTYEIETPGGVRIATDFSGVYVPSRMPDVATMNNAHSTHYTMYPDPAIKHVLHGWGDKQGEKAEHHVVVDDVYIRNVTTDIRMGFGDYSNFQQNGNSIFIFETAGLCIGHLGHLHHELTDSHYAEIGRLDILMVPVDGGLTLGADSMSRVVKRLRSALILPMHRTGPPLASFLAMFQTSFAINYAKDDVITVSMRTLPKQPTILVPKGL